MFKVRVLVRQPFLYIAMRRLDRVRTLSKSDRQLLRDLKSVIARYVPDATVILYGSAARGVHGPESDYDVLVLSPNKLSSEEEESIDAAVYDLELDRGAVLSVMLSSQAEWQNPIVRQSPYYDNVTNEGVLV